ncbi:MAG: hypothetical protein JOY66_08120 [Acetobacteraceae bacterium]|nr:hypothetical protein [Acetobacteraceae bacterium]
MTALKGLAEASRALDRLDLAPLGRDALGQAADTLAGAVRQALSHAPGEDHATPWLRTGKLRASITCEATDTVAVIGSSDPVAVDQELGTSAIPPRPFLATVAAAEADGIARGVADRIGAGLEG